MLSFLLAVSLTSSSPCIDFWGEGCGIVKQEKKLSKESLSHKKQTKKKTKEQTKAEKLEELYRKSLNWTPDNLSPLEKYVSLHPQDELAVYYLRKYLAERQIRACYLERGLALLPTDQCEKMRKAWEKWVEGVRQSPQPTANRSETSKTVGRTAGKGLRKYEFLFFFSYTCPHCQKVLPIVLEKLKNYDLVPIPATNENADEFNEWKVYTVPTLVAVDREKNKAYRLTGFNEKQLDYFLKKLEEEK